MDLLGMKFEGHPKPKKLILADDWPAGIYPLRKEVPYNLVPPAAEDVAYQLDEAPPEGCTIVPVGPFHPSLHEPAHFAVFVDGETIKGCDYRGFMTHRGIEKLCQTQVSYNEVPSSPSGSAGSAARCTPPAIPRRWRWRPGSRYRAGPNTSGPSCWRSSAFTPTFSGSASPAT